MGSLHKSIDESLGGLVWVWRRNGRWWPGRILDPEEVPDTFPSNSGTPIKLLAKDDVDWYNVEESTRVKPFRCGEYDVCIEKAKVTAAKSSKRMVKRPSKEDAIVLALEIERACLGKDDTVSNSKMTNLGHEVEDSPRSFCQHEEETYNVDENFSNSETETDSALGLSLSTVSSEDPAYTDSYKEQTMGRNLNDSDDDGAEGGGKLMKGLDNLGASAITSSTRHRFQVAHVHEFLKRKHRLRTVTKILESNVMVNVPVVYDKLAHPTKSLPRGASVWKVSGLGSDVLNTILSLKDNDDDGLYDVPMVTEEQHCTDLPLVYNTSEGVPVWGGTKSNELSQLETRSLCESGPISSCTAEVNDIIQRVDIAMSKWQLKGKRSRHTNKNRRRMRMFTDVCDEFGTSAAGAECTVDHDIFSGSQLSDNHPYPLKSRSVTEIKIDEDRGGNKNMSRAVPYGCQVSDELHAQPRLLPHRESRCSMNSKYQDFLIGHHTPESALFDVNLEVKANYRPQHVPYVSLTSKINGPSIIGHLLTVEVLKNGFCDNLISESLWDDSSSCELDDELGETTTALGGVALSLEARSNSVRQIQVKHALQNATPSKSRKCGLMSKKIRKLSSLTGARQQRVEKRLVVEKLRGPSLAFVPLTIVFSRLNEALSCPN